MKAFLTIVVSSFAVWVSAQNFSEIRSNATGEGDLRLDDVIYSLNEIDLYLDRNGEFKLILKGKRSFQFTGTWLRSAASSAALKIRGGTSRNSRGSGTIYLNPDWSFSTLSLYGDSDSGVFAGTFRSRRSGVVNPPSTIGGLLDQTRYGTGTLRYADGRNTERLTQARVVLTRRGDFEVTLFGRVASRFVGTWRYEDGNDVRFRIVDGLGKGEVSGTGLLHSDFRGGFTALELAGRAHGRTFTVTFRADGVGGGTGGQLIDFRRGDGMINGPGTEDYNLRNASVSLYRDGSFEIVLESHRAHTYRGRWSDRGSQIDLVLTNVSGAGNLVRSGRSFDRFAFSYMEDGKRYIVEFRATR